MLHGRPDADLHKVPDGVHRLGEPALGRLLRPEKGLRVRLREHAGRADEVPRGEREARVAVVLLRRDVLARGLSAQQKRGGVGTHVVVY